MQASEAIADLATTTGDDRVVPAHVVVLAGFIPAHALPLYVALSRRVRKLTVLLSTAMEADRNWKPDWGPLDVHLQRTSTLKRPRRHTLGFKDSTFIHIPWDTIPRLRKLRPDVLISAELGFRSVFSSLYKKRSRRTPMIFWTGLSEHTEKGKGWMRHLLRKWLLRQADGVVVNGRSGARYLERMGTPADRISLLTYSCLPGLFDKCPVERGPAASHRLLYVGRLIDLKGLIPFMRALARWATAHPGRNVEFTLAGDGPMRPAIEGLAMPPNVRVKLLGECSYGDLVKVYAEAGIFAFPTLSDDWGLVVNEAMTAGLPVLGSVYGQAVAELCDDAVTGWTFHPDRVPEMERAIETALSTTPDELNRMRRAARARVLDLTPARGAEQLAEAIRCTMARMQGGSAP